jgi:hypothetical protein
VDFADVGFVSARHSCDLNVLPKDRLEFGNLRLPKDDIVRPISNLSHNNHAFDDLLARLDRIIAKWLKLIICCYVPRPLLAYWPL